MDLFEDLTLWMAQRFVSEPEVSTKQVQTELEAIFALYLLKDGWESALVAARAGTCARIFIWRLYPALKQRHARAPHLARRARAIAADARKIQTLSQGATVKGHAKRLAKEIRQIAPDLDWPEAGVAAELFERISASGTQAMSPAHIDPVIERLDGIAANLKVVAEIIGTPSKPGRPRASRLFGLTVEQLAQSYFRDTGELPRAGVRQAKGRVQGDFFECVNQGIKGIRGRPCGRNALAKAILRVLNTSPRCRFPKANHFFEGES